jgi:hypothetical protein
MWEYSAVMRLLTLLVLFLDAALRLSRPQHEEVRILGYWSLEQCS